MAKHTFHKKKTFESSEKRKCGQQLRIPGIEPPGHAYSHTLIFQIKYFSS